MVLAQIPKKTFKTLSNFSSAIPASERERVVVEYLPFVIFLAKKYMGHLPPSVELDDIISCGVIGLMDAVAKFNPDKKTIFKTYAELRIRGAILDELRRYDWMPRGLRDQVKRVERARSTWQQQNGCGATAVELCAQMGISLQHYQEVLAAACTSSLVSLEEQREVVEQIPSSSMDAQNPQTMVAQNEIVQQVQEVVSKLQPNEQKVVQQYYFEEQTVREIGQELKLTSSRVSQIHTKALRSLKLLMQLELKEESVAA